MKTYANIKAGDQFILHSSRGYMDSQGQGTHRRVVLAVAMQDGGGPWCEYTELEVYEESGVPDYTHRGILSHGALNQLGWSMRTANGSITTA